MIRRIVLKNYMSHAETVIEPVFEFDVDGDFDSEHPDDSLLSAKKPGGLTVLVGENNSGKSALVSAIQTVCQNAPGDYMVRHGEKECSVTIETLEGDKLTWRRVKRKTGYVVNGREVDRLKGSVPEDLHQFLRMPLVSTSRDQVDIHFGEQKQPIFLLGDSSADRAAFFASSSDTYKLIEMQTLHRNKVSLAKRDHRASLQKQEQLQAKLKTLDPLDALEKRVTDVEEQFEALSVNLALEDKLSDLIARIDSARRSEFRYTTLCRRFRKLKSPPQLVTTDPLKQLTEKLLATKSSLHRSQAETDCLKSLGKPLGLTETAALEKTTRNLSAAKMRLDNWARKTKVLDHLQELPDTQKTISKFERLDKLCGSIQETTKSIESSKKNLIRIAVKLEESIAAIRTAYEKLDICPTCQQKIDVDHLIDKCGLTSAGNDRLDFAHLNLANEGLSRVGNAGASRQGESQS